MSKAPILGKKDTSSHYQMQNNIWFEFAFIVLRTDVPSVQKAQVTAYPPEERVNQFTKLNGVFLSTRNMTKQMTGETPDILTFEVDAVTKHAQAAAMSSGSKDRLRYKSGAYLNRLEVLPVLDPEAPMNREDSGASTANCFKATFGEVEKFNLMVVTILPFRVPDNICHFAAQEATMVMDQFTPPDYDIQRYSHKDNTTSLLRLLDARLNSIVYQVQTLAFGANERDLDVRSYHASPLGNMGVQMPSVLSVNTNYLLELERKTLGESKGHSCSLYDSQARPSVHL